MASGGAAPDDEHVRTTARGPRVVLVIPTFNRARLVGHAIDSALSQDYPDVRVVVVDDGSTDDTSAAVARFAAEPRVRVVWRERNGGVMAAKNSGIDALPADCDYFGILDSDDVLVPSAIGVLVRAFEASRTPLSQVFGWCADADTGEYTGVAPHRAGPITYQDALCGRFEGEFWQLIRRAALGDRRFDERAGGNEAMVWWPMLKESPGLLVDTVVRKYDRSGADRVNRPSFTQRGAERKMWGYRAYLERTATDTGSSCPARLAELWLEHAKWAAFAGHWRACVGSLTHAWRANPSWRVAKVGLLALAPSPLLRAAYARLHRDTR